MWVKHTLVIIFTLWLCSFVILHWYTSQMMLNKVTVNLDETLWYTSLKCTWAISPSIACIWIFHKFLVPKPVTTIFILTFMGSILGIILQLVLYTQSIIATEQQYIAQPSIYMSQLSVDYWSFGGSLSGMFLASVISYMFYILNEEPI